MVGGEAAGAGVSAGENGCGVLVDQHRLKITEGA